MKNKNYFAAILICGIALAFGGCATPQKQKHAAAAPQQQLIPLELFWDGRDYYTTSPQGENSAESAGYKFVRVEGYIFAKRQPGTVPLKQFWSESRHDYMLLGTALPKTLKENAAYELVRVEGYAYAKPHLDAVPLKRFAHVSGDNFTTATAQGAADAQAANYSLRRIEAYVIPAPGSSDVVAPAKTYEATSGGKEIILKSGQRFDTAVTFRPPVEITIVAKTDSTNLRIGYAADQVIFNWELDRNQLRVDGGPANGLHKPGAGGIPPGEFVQIRWLVTTNHQAIYVNNDLRFEHSGDYSGINKSVSVFPASGSTVTIKSLTVQPLSASETATAQTVKVEAISAEQIQNWIAQLGDTDFSARDKAVKELSRHSAEALPALNAALQKETDSDRRWWIQSAIQECQNTQTTD